MHEEGGCCSAFVDEVLVEAEGRVAGVGPGFTVAVGVLLVALLDIVEVACPNIPPSWATSVVRKKKDQRIIESLRFLEVATKFALFWSTRSIMAA